MEDVRRQVPQTMQEERQHPRRHPVKPVFRNFRLTEKEKKSQQRKHDHPGEPRQQWDIRFTPDYLDERAHTPQHPRIGGTCKKSHR
jgi:hypothetical protein